MVSKSTTTLPGYALVFASLALFTGVAYGQVPVDDSGNPIVSLYTADSGESAYAPDSEPLTPVELETLVGPIALYPDDLLAIVLPASTYPLQIVQAARFLEAYESDRSIEPDESWDESVIALLNYPEAMRLLNDDIDWTWQLGEAVIAQQGDIIRAVESFRDRAYAAGNLQSDEHQTVSRNANVIEIDPLEDDIIYVPYYEPEQVVLPQPQRVYYYYDSPRPVYYYPYPTGYTFSSGYFWGVTTAFQIGWASNHLRVYHLSYRGHPYYGHNYFGHHYRRPSISVHNTVYVNNARRYSPQRFRDGDYWRPRRHVGARPSDYYAHTRHYRTDVRRTHHRTRRNGSQHRDLGSHNSHQSRQRSRAQDPIRFRQRDPGNSHRDRNNSMTVRREQHTRPEANRRPDRVQRIAWAGRTERNRERQKTHVDKRNRQQVRQTPPRRQVVSAAHEQRRQQPARSGTNQPQRRHDNKSQQRQQPVRKDRTHEGKSGRSEHASHDSRKKPDSGRHERRVRQSR